MLSGRFIATGIDIIDLLERFASPWTV